MVRFPSGAPHGRSNVNVQRLDIAPTVLAELGISQPPWMTGVSLLDAEASIRRDREFLAANMTQRIREHGRGMRLPGSALTYTTIRCDRFAKLYPNGEIDRGLVSGSTSTCVAAPEISRSLLARPTTRPTNN